MKVTILLTAFAEPGKAPAQIRYSREALDLGGLEFDDLREEAFEIFNAPIQYLTDEQRKLRDSVESIGRYTYAPSVGDFIVLEGEGHHSIAIISPTGFTVIAEGDDTETMISGILQLVAELSRDGARRGLFDELAREDSEEIADVLNQAYLRSIKDLGEALLGPEKAEEKPTRFADLPAGPISVEFSREELGALFDLANVFEPGSADFPGMDSEEFAENVGSAWNTLLSVLNR